jgi:deazaflavin-dependent oxidoreductase (nitroreductase family)
MSTKIPIGAPNWQQTHIDLYLKTDGAEGHLVDFTAAGGPLETPCLILKTTGRKTGSTKLAPLIYGVDGANYVIVASKGGAPNHPAWFLNLEADPTVGFQVVDKKFDGVARIADGAERERLFAMMAKLYPPYDAYQAKTSRQIPVVVLEPRRRVERL